MPVERSGGIIIFRDTPRGRRYLLIRAARNVARITKFKVTGIFWDVPKGLLRRGEKGIDAALRETKEEVGIVHPQIISGFKETVRYFTWRDRKPIPKFVALFLGRVRGMKVSLSWEHDRYRWVPYRDARTLITLPQMKRALSRAERFLKKIS